MTWSEQSKAMGNKRLLPPPPRASPCVYPLTPLSFPRASGWLTELRLCYVRVRVRATGVGVFVREMDEMGTGHGRYETAHTSGWLLGAIMTIRSFG